MIIKKASYEIGRIRRAGRIVAESFRLVEQNLGVGITTEKLNRTVEKYIEGQKARPAFRGYHGFPASICISINEGVVHGIPDATRIKDGDIISVDIGVEHNGYYADAAKTFIVGKAPDEVRRLVRLTQKALFAGILQCTAGNHLSDISHQIQKVAEQEGYSVVRDFVGHGIGQSMHEDPQIPNYGKAGRGPILEEGMVFALEPMVNLGTYEVEILADNWTVVTKDRKPSAHFEHTVAVGENKPKILTAA